MFSVFLMSAMDSPSPSPESNNTADLHTAERVVIKEEQVNTLNEETRTLVDGAPLVLARVNTQEAEFINREMDTGIKEKPSNNDLGNIKKAIVELMKQHYNSPPENPFSYQWIADCVLFSVVTTFLLQKGWKKQGPRSLRDVGGCNLQVASCRLQVAGCRLQVAGEGCRL